MAGVISPRFTRLIDMQRLKELLEQLKLHFQVEIAMADILDEHDVRLKKLEDYRLKNDTQVSVLRKQYSECLMVLKDINRKLDGRK